MDGNNWRRGAAQPQPQSEPQQQQLPSSMDAGAGGRSYSPIRDKGLSTKIMDTLKRHLPFSGQEGLHELKKIAVRFEEKIYLKATSQTNHHKEIRKINQHLTDTVVDISDEDVNPNKSAAAATKGGIIIKCSSHAVALGPNWKSQYSSAQMSPIQRLWLLVNMNYPRCSLELLDKFPAEVSKDLDDLSVNAKSRFSISLRSISQAMSLKDIVRIGTFLLVLLFLMRCRVVGPASVLDMVLGKSL